MQRSLGAFKLFSRCGVSVTCCIFVFLLAMFSVASLSAQTAGTISGHVADTTGAVIPGAAVTLTNVATSTARSTVTTGAGDYLFFAVPPGTYNVSVSHSGFEAASTQSVAVAVEQSLQLNFTLRVGSTSTTVTVAAAAALLQVNNTTLGTVVPTQTLAQMPLNSRNYLGLVALSANANTLSPTQGQAGSRLGGARAGQSISVGGSRIMFDHYTLDGINNSDPDFNTFIVQPTVDAISQMKVQTGVYPAEFGYNATQINVVTKSGGNQFHGTAFEFLRNNYADALGYNYQYPNPLPAVLPYKYNDYGFVIDGPVTIPHVFNGKNRFFFMANDEWYSQISVGSSTSSLPTSAILGGDFSQYTGTTQGGPVIPIYDPATGNADGTGRTQFDYNGTPNKINPNRIDPISAKFISLYYAAAQTSDFTGNYRYSTSSKDTHDGFTARGDFYQSGNSQWAFRFSNGLETNPSQGFTTPGGTVGSNIITKYYQYMGSNTWTISPTVVNVATFGWTNFYNSLGLFSQGSDDDVTKIGIPNLAPGPPSTWGIPALGFSSDNYSGLGDSSDGPYVTSDPNISINDNISVVKGKHSLSLGFQYERQTFNELGNQESRGNFSSEANATAEVSAPGVLVPKTGSAFADFWLGQLYQSTYAVQIAQADYKRNVEAVYFDDSYKISPKMSFQAGLRYELTPPWYNTLGQEFMPDFRTNNSPVSPASGTTEPQNLWPEYMRQGKCQSAYQGINVRWVESDNVTPVTPQPQCANGDYPDSMMSTDYTNWAPRIGLSYSATPTLVIRTGYGMYYNHDTANARFDVARNLAGRVTLTTGQGTPGVANLNWENAVIGGGTAKVPPPYAFAMAYDHNTSFSEIWLLDVQKQVGTNWSFEGGYMGSHSGNLYGFRNANFSIPYGYVGNGAPTSILARSPYPNYGVIQYVHDVGYANYNAFSIKINKRFSDGFNLISSYTFSKALDDTSGIRSQSSELFPQSDLCITCEYGPSDFDVRHRVVGSLIYGLPVGQQAGAFWKPSSKIVDAVIGGWQYNFIGTLQTGRPYSMSVSGDGASTNTIVGGTNTTRPNAVAGVDHFVSHPTVGKTGQWLNAAAWTQPAPGFIGDTNRNYMNAPGVKSFDMSLDKNFNMPYSEHHQLQIRFDAFNALNITNYGTPGQTVNTLSSFGKITGSSTSARQLQLAARYTF